MDYTEKTLKTEEIFDGKVIRVSVDTVELPNGKTATRELVGHPGGVGIIAVTENRQVYMVRQYRRPFDESVLEVPAGKLEYGEDPLSCGIRELGEEAGVTAKNMQHIGDYYVSPGFCREVIHLYLATDLTPVKQHLDEDEFLDVLMYDLDELIDMVMNNQIHDAKTAIAILKAKSILK